MRLLYDAAYESRASRTGTDEEPDSCYRVAISLNAQHTLRIGVIRECYPTVTLKQCGAGAARVDFNTNAITRAR